MPKIHIEFNIPEENEEYKIYSKAMDMHCALWSFSQDVLRPMWKHGCHNNRELTEAEMELIEHVREEFYRIMTEYGIEL